MHRGGQRSRPAARLAIDVALAIARRRSVGLADEQGAARAVRRRRDVSDGCFWGVRRGQARRGAGAWHRRAAGAAEPPTRCERMRAAARVGLLGWGCDVPDSNLGHRLTYNL
eukprot:SAG31_NODE_2181_length_6246_cov_12.867252_1_plen_112_part_00